MAELAEILTTERQNQWWGYWLFYFIFQDLYHDCVLLNQENNLCLEPSLRAETGLSSGGRIQENTDKYCIWNKCGWEAIFIPSA